MTAFSPRLTNEAVIEKTSSDNPLTPLYKRGEIPFLKGGREGLVLASIQLA
jgi:hypothetical protein